MKSMHHMAFGAFSTVAGLELAQAGGLIALQPIEKGAAICAAVIASAIPDIDHPDSIVSHISVWSLFLGIALYLVPAVDFLSRLFQAGLLPWLGDLQAQYPGWSLQQILGLIMISSSAAALFLSHALEHRGTTHSILGWFVMTLGVTAGYSLSGSPAWVAFSACFSWGYFLHLLADSRSPKGLPNLFWPLDSHEGLMDWLGELWESITYRLSS